MIPPGKTIGMLGGGQLGRMTGQAARELGYGFVVLEPSKRCPAGQVADLEINAAYDDPEGLARLADASDVVSFEFENVAIAALQSLETKALVHPKPRCLHICQNRLREKQFLSDNGFPHAPFRLVDSADALAEALKEIGTPSVLKTADFGYDGKGQQKLTDPEASPAEIWSRFEGARAVLEGWMAFEREISVVVACGSDGQAASFPVAENIHTHHILDYSIVPARIPNGIAEQAQRLAETIAKRLGIVGLLGVELFLMSDGTLAVNELAPRPHNSGHYTMDACATSQFEQFVRAICGLPLGSTALLSPVVMVNILGDAWDKREPDFAAILAHPAAKLHLYGKANARKGRKMGHFCVRASSADEALRIAQDLKARL